MLAFKFPLFTEIVVLNSGIRCSYIYLVIDIIMGATAAVATATAVRLTQSTVRHYHHHTNGVNDTFTIF